MKAKLDVGLANKCGKMDHFTRASGGTEGPTAKEDLSIRMVTFTKVAGKMTKHMEKEYIDIWTEQYIKVNLPIISLNLFKCFKVIGTTTSSMAKERKRGQISQSTTETM